MYQCLVSIESPCKFKSSLILNPLLALDTDNSVCVHAKYYTDFVGVGNSMYSFLAGYIVPLAIATIHSSSIDSKKVLYVCIMLAK